MVEWETGEITEEPLSIIAKDDPVTCAAYAMEHNLLHLPEWSNLQGYHESRYTWFLHVNMMDVTKWD